MPSVITWKAKLYFQQQHMQSSGSEVCIINDDSLYFDASYRCEFSKYTFMIWTSLATVDQQLCYSGFNPDAHCYLLGVCTFTLCSCLLPHAN